MFTFEWNEKYNRLDAYWHDVRVCPVCKDTMAGKRAAACYCSQACKQAAYRENLKTEEFRRALVTRRSGGLR